MRHTLNGGRASEMQALRRDLATAYAHLAALPEPSLPVLRECLQRRPRPPRRASHCSRPCRRRRPAWVSPNLGESSGVVAALIAKACPFVVSAAGSFQVYQEVAWMASSGVAAPDLARLIQAMLADPRRHAAGTAAYATRHRAQDLARIWFGGDFERP